MKRICSRLLNRKPPGKRAIRFLSDGYIQGSDLFLESENFIISGDAKTVSSGKHCQNAFKRGEKILAAHFDTKTPVPASAREALLLLKKFVSLFPELKRQGYAGLVGDTSNSAIVSSFRKHGAQIMLPSRLAQVQARRRYKIAVREHNYPAKYVQGPVQRIIMRF